MRAYLKSAMAHARIAVSRSIPHKTACAQPPTPIRPTSHGDDGDFLFVAPRGKIYVNVIAAAVAPPPPPTSSVNVCVCVCIDGCGALLCVFGCGSVSAVFLLPCTHSGTWWTAPEDVIAARLGWRLAVNGFGRIAQAPGSWWVLVVDSSSIVVGGFSFITMIHRNGAYACACSGL